LNRETALADQGRSACEKKKKIHHHGVNVPAVKSLGDQGGPSGGRCRESRDPPEGRQKLHLQKKRKVNQPGKKTAGVNLGLKKSLPGGSKVAKAP